MTVTLSHMGVAMATGHPDSGMTETAAFGHMHPSAGETDDRAGGTCLKICQAVDRIESFVPLVNKASVITAIWGIGATPMWTSILSDPSLRPPNPVLVV
jgi:hypothetical protein